MNTANLQLEGLLLSVAAAFAELKRKGASVLRLGQRSRSCRGGSVAAHHGTFGSQCRSDPVSHSLSKGSASRTPWQSGL